MSLIQIPAPPMPPVAPHWEAIEALFDRDEKEYERLTLHYMAGVNKFVNWETNHRVCDVGICDEWEGE